MKVYIEYVLIDNLVIDFLILYLTGKILKHKFKWVRILISCVLGASSTIALSLINILSELLLAFKLLIGLVLPLFAFKFKSFKQYLSTFFTFLSFTFLLGGACFALIGMFGSFNSNFSGYDASIPLGLMLIICAVLVKIVTSLTTLIYQKRDCNKFLAKTTLTILGNAISFDGFIDSGNRLYDDKTGLPVIIVATSAFQGQNNNLLKEILKNPKKMARNAHFISVGTLNGETKPMLVFEPDKAEFYYQNKTIQSKIMVGLTYRGFKDVINYDALLHPSLIGG